MVAHPTSSPFSRDPRPSGLGCLGCSQVPSESWASGFQPLWSSVRKKVSHILLPYPDVEATASFLCPSMSLGSGVVPVFVRGLADSEERVRHREAQWQVSLQLWADRGWKGQVNRLPPQPQPPCPEEIQPLLLLPLSDYPAHSPVLGLTVTLSENSAAGNFLLSTN